MRDACRASDRVVQLCRRDHLPLATARGYCAGAGRYHPPTKGPLSLKRAGEPLGLHSHLLLPLSPSISPHPPRYLYLRRGGNSGGGEFRGGRSSRPPLPPSIPSSFPIPPLPVQMADAREVDCLKASGIVPRFSIQPQ